MSTQENMDVSNVESIVDNPTEPEVQPEVSFANWMFLSWRLQINQQ